MATMRVHSKHHYVDVLPGEPVPDGQYLVHNHIAPVKPLGRNGFRAWTQSKANNLVECRCDFGGCKNAKVHTRHYRVDLDRVPRQARLTMPQDAD